MSNHTLWTRRSVLKSLGLGAAVFTGALPRLGHASPSDTGEGFRMVFLTDTHLDMKCSKENLSYISEWITDNAAELNIQFVGHHGDVGDRRGSGDIGEMLKASREALQPVMDAGIPLSVAIGNHDYDSASDTRPCEAFNDSAAFGRAFYEGQPWFGGTFEDETDDPGPDPGGAANHYVLLELGGRTFLFLTLELYPRDKVMDWADELVRVWYPTREVVVSTHAYLHRQGHLATGVGYDGFSRDDGPEYSNDGEEMWERYFKHWPHLRLVSGGHFIDEPRQNYLEQAGEHGNTVHSHFWNYQNWAYDDGELYNTRREGQYQAATVKMFDVRLDEEEVHIENYIPPAGAEGDPADPNHHDTWG